MPAENRPVAVSDRIPPQSLAMEQSTLGAMLIERAAVDAAAGLLKPEDFYREAHRYIFGAILDLAERSEPVDLMSVQEELNSRGLLKPVGGAPYLVQLTDAVPAAANVEHYARVVADRALRRRLVDAGAQIQALAHSEDLEGGAEEALDRAMRTLLAAGETVKTGDMKSVRPLVAEVFEEVERLSETKGTLAGNPTGFSELDYLLGGFEPGLVLLGGRPSMGKTAFMVSLASKQLRRGNRVAIFSMDSRDKNLVRRIIAGRARVSLMSMRNGTLRDDEWARMGPASAEVSEEPLWISDAGTVTAGTVRRDLRRLAARSGPLGLVIVDYLQLMTGTKGENRTQELAWIAKDLRTLAKEFGCAFLALSQLSREVDKRPNKRPQMSDFRDSGGIEAEADVALGIYREEYYAAKSEGRAEQEEHDVEIIVLKQKDGATGTVTLRFIPQYMEFAEIDHRHEDPRPGRPARNQPAPARRGPYASDRDDPGIVPMDTSGWNDSLKGETA